MPDVPPATWTAADRARGWVELTRASNLPTVWSNVLHGLAAGLFVMLWTLEGTRNAAVAQMPVGVGWYLNQGFMLLLGMSLIYTAGMVLNDAFDARDDAAHRPSRPIPSGRVSRGVATAVGFTMLVAGVAATSVYRCAAVWMLAAFLAALVVAYNLLHRVKLFAYLLMPLCRALVVLTAATAYPQGNGGEPWVWHVALPAGAIAVYTAVITLVSWSEHLAGRESLRAVVPVLIALMPVIDAVFLGWIGLWPLAALCLGCSVLALALQRVVPGT